MITSITRFPLRPGLDRAAVVEDIKSTIPVYRGCPGLIRKYIGIDLENGHGAGIYLWQDRASADAYYAIAMAKMKEQLGVEPEVTFLDTPVVVDNRSGEVEID
jgi:hypothetical protein